MIIKGTSRAGASELGTYLSTQGQNETVQVVEVRGTVAPDPLGAVIEMEAYAAGTRCEKPLYHAMINPEPPHRLTAEQRAEAVDALEEKLGFVGHARVVVVHDKKDREHIHIVWSRIDLENMRSVSDSHNYRKHEEVSRDLEQRFGHDRVQGAHVGREGVERPDRTPSRSDLRQEERTGITGKDVKQEITEAYRSSDGAEAFKAALEDRGYLIAQGDRRDFVLIDRAGGIHSLARRIDGVKAAELREFMSPISRESLPTVEQVRGLIDARARIADDDGDPSLEKAYGRGDGYVGQSSAAQRDFEQRQAHLTDQWLASGGEITDAKQARLAQLFGSNGGDHPPDDDDRQPRAPGGGHTRSR